MLRTLRIRQLVLIEDVTLEFGPGLTLLTGETGAGKSILVGALGLAVGQRGDRSLVRSGAERAVVEALFDLVPGSPAHRWAEERGLDDLLEEGQVVVRRELAASGNGKVSLNGSPCALTHLRELGGRLLELHGQHEQQSLLAPERHLTLIDRIGAHGEALARVRRSHADVLEATDELAQWRVRAAAREERMAQLERAIAQIDAVKPVPGEREALDRERSRLRNAAQMLELLDEVVETGCDGEPSAVALGARMRRAAALLATLDPGLAELAARVDSALVEIEDVGAAFRDYRDRENFDSDRLDEVEQRRAALDELCLRYGSDEQAVLEQREQTAAELAALRDIDGELARAAGRLDEAERAYVRAARGLSRDRRAAARRLEPSLVEQFAELALAQARFQVRFSPAKGSHVGGNGAGTPLNARGAERAEFLLAANAGEAFRELQRVASGGELSRVMLALHAVVEDAAAGRVLVFDEVDSGVSGAVADAVGARLAHLAAHQQVLCVTHLPQVAAYGTGHYVVSKRTVGERTLAEVRGLARDERIEELARMLAGKSPTQASRRHAGELLDAAGRVAERRSV